MRCASVRGGGRTGTVADCSRYTVRSPPARPAGYSVAVRHPASIPSHSFTEVFMAEEKLPASWPHVGHHTGLFARIWRQSRQLSPSRNLAIARPLDGDSVSLTIPCGIYNKYSLTMQWWSSVNTMCARVVPERPPHTAPLLPPSCRPRSSSAQPTFCGRRSRILVWWW